VSDLSDRHRSRSSEGSAVATATSQLRRSQDSRVPGAGRRRVVAHEARRRMAPGEQTGPPGRGRGTPQRETLGKQPEDPPSPRGLRAGNEALKRGHGPAIGAPPRQPHEGRGRATGTDPFEGKGFERAPTQAAGEIDLPDRRARCTHRQRFRANDGSRTANAGEGSCQAPSRRGKKPQESHRG